MEQANASEDFRSKVIEELNSLRTNPQAYSAKVRKYIGYFKGKVMKIPSGESIMTNEGAEAFEEAAKFLDDFKAVEALVYNPGLTHACHEYLEAVSGLETDQMGDVSLESYVEKHGELNGSLGQSVDFGSHCPELAVVNLVVDDGDSNRGNRKSVLDKKFKQIGVAKGSHKIYEHCTVLMYAQEFKPNKTCEEKEQKLKEIKEIKQKAEEAAKKVESVKIEDDDFEIPEGYVKVERQEKVVTENGVQKKLVKLIKHKEDGTTDTEIFKVNA